MIKTETLQKRIKNGVKLLNRVSPDWCYRVNLRDFDMAYDGKCVIGQLYGWTQGIEKIFNNPLSLLQAAYSYGFCFSQKEVNRLDKDNLLFKQYDVLTNLWKIEITRLRKEYADVVPVVKPVKTTTSSKVLQEVC